MTSNTAPGIAASTGRSGSLPVKSSAFEDLTIVPSGGSGATPVAVEVGTRAWPP